MTRTWGVILLCIWLCCMGAVQALSLHFDWQGVIMGAVAIAAAVCILIGK